MSNREYMTEWIAKDGYSGWRGGKWSMCSRWFNQIVDIPGNATHIQLKATVSKPRAKNAVKLVVIKLGIGSWDIHSPAAFLVLPEYNVLNAFFPDAKHGDKRTFWLQVFYKD